MQSLLVEILYSAILDVFVPFLQLLLIANGNSKNIHENQYDSVQSDSKLNKHIW